MSGGKTVVIGNKKISYKVIGNGEPVVLLHGFAEDGNVWKHQTSELEKSYRLIIPDLPGSGESELTGDVTMEAMAEMIRQLLKEENIDQAIFIGHSMGGYVTLAFAEKYPGLLKAFGLFHSTAYADTEEKRASRKKSIDFIKAHGTLEFLKQSTPNLFSSGFKEKHPEVINQLIQEYKSFPLSSLIAYYEAMMKRPDRTEVLQKFNKPILFIIGKEDNAIPLNDSLRQSHLPVFSYIHILEQSGHMGLWEEKDKANNILLQFLAESC